MMVVLVTFVDVSGKPGLHTRAPLYIMCVVHCATAVVHCCVRFALCALLLCASAPITRKRRPRSAPSLQLHSLVFVFVALYLCICVFVSLYLCHCICVVICM